MPYALLKSFITPTSFGSLVQRTSCEMLHLMNEYCSCNTQHFNKLSFCVNPLKMAKLYDRTRMSKETQKYCECHESI
jgi:hypothetical protein